MKKVLQLLTLTTLLTASLSADTIYEATSRGDIEAVRQFIAADRACVNATHDYTLFTPLRAAALQGHLEIVELLINNGANVNVQDDQGETPLMVAAWKGHTEIAKRLLDYGAEVNETTFLYGGTPLHCAKNQRMTKLLIKHGANVNTQDCEGKTPLHDAASRGHLKTIKYLISHGANVSTRANSGKTAQQVAERDGHKKTARLFSTRMLWHAICRNNVAVAELALARGANANAVAKKWMLPQSENVPAKTLKCLRDAITRGDTPLHIAVENGNAKMVELLLGFGGAIDRANKGGTTPFGLAVAQLTARNPAILNVIYDAADPAKACAVIKRPQVFIDERIQALKDQIEECKKAIREQLGSFREELGVDTAEEAIAEIGRILALRESRQTEESS